MIVSGKDLDEISDEIMKIELIPDPSNLPNDPSEH